jgi:dephospho-CoA kinase
MSIIKSQCLKLGVTGGIGSGKSSVCKVFRLLGVPVFSADEEAGMIMDNDKGLIMRINSLAGRDLYSGGHLDRKAFAELVFNDRKMLERVNSLVHPVVFEHFNNWVEKQTSPYAIMEAAILIESGALKIVDKIAVVVAPVEERIARVMQRNTLSRQQVLDRIKNQTDDETRLKWADYVIANSETDFIIPSILAIHKELIDNLNTLN